MHPPYTTSMGVKPSTGYGLKLTAEELKTQASGLKAEKNRRLARLVARKRQDHTMKAKRK